MRETFFFVFLGAGSPWPGCVGGVVLDIMHGRSHMYGHGPSHSQVCDHRQDFREAG